MGVSAAPASAQGPTGGPDDPGAAVRCRLRSSVSSASADCCSRRRAMPFPSVVWVSTNLFTPRTRKAPRGVGRKADSSSSSHCRGHNKNNMPRKEGSHKKKEPASSETTEVTEGTISYLDNFLQSKSRHTHSRVRPAAAPLSLLPAALFHPRLFSRHKLTPLSPCLLSWRAAPHQASPKM